MVAEDNYTANELAKILRVKIHRVHELTRQDILPHFKLGCQVRFPARKIQEFIESGGKSLPGGWRENCMMSTTITRTCICIRPKPQRQSEKLELECHRCHRAIELDPHVVAGGNVRCPRCGTTLQIEVAEAASA